MDRVIRVGRSDQEDDTGFVLVRVIRAHADKLDCHVMGTDGNAAFETRLNDAQISTLKAAKFDGTDEDWAGIVHWVLFRRNTSNANTTNIELVAQVSESTFSLIVRQRLEGGITPRLGSIQLRRNDQLEDNIELFEWAGLAASTARSKELDLDSLELQLKKSTLECDRLRDQLQDLVEARKEHEQILLGKFRQLLNAKKMKIRDQQRLLAGAKIDAKNVARHAEASNTKAQVHGSRSVKRKADHEGMDVTRNEHGNVSEDDEIRVVTPTSTHVDSEEEELIDAPPPPRRELPFGSYGRAPQSASRTKGAAMAAQPLHDLDETEDDDDEL